VVNDDVAGMVQVQANAFDVLGVRPLIGGFTSGDFEWPALAQPMTITPVIIRR
jgi:hypothetical protein